MAVVFKMPGAALDRHKADIGRLPKVPNGDVRATGDQYKDLTEQTREMERQRGLHMLLDHTLELCSLLQQAAKVRAGRMGSNKAGRRAH